MLRVLMLALLLATTRVATGGEPLQAAAVQTEQAQEAVQSVLEEIEDSEAPQVDTFEDAVQRANILPAGTFPLLEQALADPTQRANIGALMANAEALAKSVQAPGEEEDGVMVYAFASFSMPEASLKALIRQGELAGVPVVLRGLVEDSVETTLARVQALYTEQDRPAGGVLIDPTLFARFAVEQVPTVIVAEREASPCTPDACPTPPHVKLAGDVPLRYALDRIANAAPDYDDRLRPKIAALEPGRTW